MAKYRKRPVVVEAVQWFPGTQVEGIIALRCSNEPRCGASLSPDSETCALCGHPPGVAVIRTLEGLMNASAGDFIITGVKGEKYPCKPDIFAATYEHAEG